MTYQRSDLRDYEGAYAADDDADGYLPTGYDDLDGPERAALRDSLDEWDGQDWDAPEWDAPEWDSAEWDAAPSRTRAPLPPSRPWYRDPRWLFGLIALAAAALVVATVLLVTGRNSGEIPTAPELTTRTPSSSTSVSSPRPPRESASASTSSATPSTSASSTSEEPDALDVPPPAEPTASFSEVPPEPAAPSQSSSPAGPRINVTRTPMSFSPGKR